MSDHNGCEFPFFLFLVKLYPCLNPLRRPLNKLGKSWSTSRDERQPKYRGRQYVKLYSARFVWVGLTCSLIYPKQAVGRQSRVWKSSIEHVGLFVDFVSKQSSNNEGTCKSNRNSWFFETEVNRIRKFSYSIFRSPKLPLVFLLNN